MIDGMEAYLLRSRVYTRMIKWMDAGLWIDLEARERLRLSGTCQLYLARLLSGFHDNGDVMDEHAVAECNNLLGPHGYAYYRALEAARSKP